MIRFLTKLFGSKRAHRAPARTRPTLESLETREVMNAALPSLTTAPLMQAAVAAPPAVAAVKIDSASPAEGHVLASTPVSAPGSRPVGRVTSPDGKHVAVVFAGPAGEWVVEDGKQVGGVYRNVSHVQFSPDSKHLAFVVQAFDVYKTYATWGDPRTQVVADGKVVGGTYYGVDQLQFSPDSKHLAFVAHVLPFAGAVEVIEDGKAVGGMHETIRGLQFSPDSKHLAFAFDDPFAIILRQKSEAVIEDGKVVGGRHDALKGLHFTPNSKDLVFVAVDGPKQRIIEVKS